jgi:oligopeptide transport system ATP-binding protein
VSDNGSVTPTAVDAPILDVRGLRKAFKARAVRRMAESSGAQRPALVDVSLTLGRGDSLGVVGESGSGKTTLARCLVRLEVPDAGRIVFDGHDISRSEPPPDVRRRLQLIFQDPYASLNPRMSVGDALREVVRVHHLVPSSAVNERVVDLLADVGLPPDAARRYPAAFSGGQRQRICIARALAAQPDLLVADEAVSSLDVSIQAQILGLLIDLRQRLGLTLLFISHNLFVVRYVAERVAVMFGGRIVESLPADVPLEEARHPYTQALIAAAPRLELRPPAHAEKRISAQASALPATGCPYRERCPRAFEPCESIDPPALPVGRPDHLVACHAVAADQAALDMSLRVGPVASMVGAAMANGGAG